MKTLAAGIFGDKNVGVRNMNVAMPHTLIHPCDHMPLVKTTFWIPLEEPFFEAEGHLSLFPRIFDSTVAVRQCEVIPGHAAP